MALGKLPEADIEGSEEAIFADINITPLTDIFLVMLIIFMVASSAAAEKAVQQATADKRSGLKVNLPTGAAKEIKPGGNPLVVSIPKDGDIVVNGTRVKDSDLDNLFRRAFAKNNNTQLVLRADEGVTHGRVVGVMERAREVGITHLAIATRSASGK